MPGCRIWLLALLSAVVAGITAAEPRLEYNRDVRPILAEHCFKCHGPDSAARKADLRLDQRDAAVDASALVPGKPEESEAIRRIFSDDPEEVMPPPQHTKRISAAQKELLRQWVAAGAEYQLHWSFIPPQRAALPNVKQRDWIQNPIDAFVLARLEAKGLAPAPPADRRIIARRVSLDLRGLPPSVEEVESFVNDPHADLYAYEKYVDRLLQSQQWGEHRARYWLDAARYADTHGIHFDNYREMWTYRDWVIQAFNQNMPFDRFTLEQLAGDLLPNRTLDQQIASGFNRCNMTTNEGGIIDEEYLVLYTRDRTETVSQVWLGLTMGCATCHDHKFDPISQREFYAMSAFFNNTTQDAKDGNIKDTPPIIVVPALEDRPLWNELSREIPKLRMRLDARKQEARPEFERWQTTATADVVAREVPVNDLHLHAPLDEGTGNSARILVANEPRQITLPDKSSWKFGPHERQALQCTGGICEFSDLGDFEKDQPFTCAAWVQLPANDASGAILSCMDNAHDYRGWDFWVERRRVGTHIVHHWADDALKVVSKQQVPANKWTHVVVTYDGSAKASGVQIYFNGQRQETQVQADQLRNSIRTDVPFRIGQRNSSDPIAAVGLQDVRVYRRALTPSDAESLAKSSQLSGIVAKPADQRTTQEKDELFSWWLATQDLPYVELSAESARLQRQQNDIKARGTIAHVMQERDEPAMAYVLFRGEYDKRRNSVKSSTPGILPPLRDGAAQNRLGLAEWLTSPGHPLTARVTVNRFWQEIFGTGIVLTTGDFGVSGDQPSHAELLDWLAVEFRESAWDIKRLFKLIVMSNTYRQAALVTPEKVEKDPQNRLLSRGPRFRMDAEMLRDYSLAASGLMSRKIGGPSVKPYQPDGVWESIAMNVSNTRSYVPDKGEGLYRRSLYTFWKRQAPPASMEIFNAPSREFCVVRRERTNTPLQALASLNDPQFIEAARQLALGALRSEVTDSGRSDWLVKRLLARPLQADEHEVVQRSLRELMAYYVAHPDDARQLLKAGESSTDESLDPSVLAAWNMLANQLMNLDEVLCK